MLMLAERAAIQPDTIERASIDDELRGSILDSYSMSDEDTQKLARDIYQAQIAGAEGAYRQAVRAAGGRLPHDFALPDELLKTLAADSLATAEGVAATYGRDLARYVDAHLEDFSGLSRNQIAGRIGTWAQDRAQWKSKQIADTETGTGVSAGNSQFIRDFADDPTRYGMEDGADFEIAIVPDDSSPDFCADFAGEVYSLDDYFDLPDFPAHSGCIHQGILIRTGSATESAADAGLEEGDDMSALDQDSGLSEPEPGGSLDAGTIGQLIPTPSGGSGSGSSSGKQN